MSLEAFGLFIMLAGFVIGLGAVTVIDLHGFLGRKSSYWTEATTRTHKVTKPLIWLGITLAYIGGFMFYQSEGFTGVPMLQFFAGIALVINGIFLSFWVSPYMLQREKEGKASELLPMSWQRKIIFSFIISAIGWWGSLALLVWYIVG